MVSWPPATPRPTDRIPPVQKAAVTSARLRHRPWGAARLGQQSESRDVLPVPHRRRRPLGSAGSSNAVGTPLPSPAIARRVAYRQVLARDREHHVADEPLERLVLDELLVDLGVVLQEVLHHLGQRLVVRHARGVRRVLPGVLIGRVGGDLGRDVVADAFRDPIGVGEQRAELLVEGLDRCLTSSKKPLA